MAIPKKCKVSVLESPKKMVLKTVDIPAVGADEILVKVEGCGICGTDVHEYKGDPFKFCPIQLGHEGTGEIVALGKNVKTDFTGKPLKVGDKIVTGLKPCGETRASSIRRSRSSATAARSSVSCPVRSTT